MANPKFENRLETDLAYIEHAGRYDQIPWDKYIPRLYTWAKEQKVMPGFFPMGIYLDNPTVVSGESCRSEIGITFKRKAMESGGVKIRHMPAQKMATVSFKGPGTEYDKAYAELEKWIDEKGYRVSGPSIEIYSKKPEVIDGITFLYSKILMPVEEK